MNEKYVDIINRRLSKLSLFVNQSDTPNTTTEVTSTDVCADDDKSSDVVTPPVKNSALPSPRFTYMGKNYFPGDIFTLGDISYKVKCRGVMPSKIKDIINKPPVS
jgi:hypothetical protein